nr:reverse transcriptase domain-containing protein [Tanacetum cinerariifolium]
VGAGVSGKSNRRGVRVVEKWWEVVGDWLWVWREIWEYLENSPNAITPDLPTKEPDNSLCKGYEHLDTISEMESDDVIKSSVEDLVPIPSESEGISEDTCDVPFCGNSPPLDVLNDHFELFYDFNDDCTSCDDFSLINVFEEKFVTFSNPLFNSNDDFTSSNDESLSDEDVSKDNFKIYSNSLFEFDDEYISSDVNPLFDEVLKDIKCKDSYDSNFDESTFLVTPLFDSNKDEYFILGDDVELLLHRDPSMSVASILEGFIDEPPLEKNDDLFDLESKNNEWKKILYDAPINDLMSEDKVFDHEIYVKNFSPTYVSLPSTDRHYILFTYVIQILLLSFTYPVVSDFLLSFGNEDTIFDPGISIFHFSHQSGTFISFHNPSGSGLLPSNTVANPNGSPPEVGFLMMDHLFLLLFLLSPSGYPKKVPEKLRDPVGIAEDVFVKVGKFHFPTDFVVVDYVVDPRFLLILERPFWRTRRALIDVYGEELTLRVDDKAITYKVGQTSKYSYNDAKSINQIDVIDVACEEYVQKVLGFSEFPKSGNPTPTSKPIIASSSPSFTPFEGSDFIMEEIETFLRTPDEIPNLDDDYYDTEGDILYLEKLLNEDPSLNLPPVKSEDLKQVDATMTKPSIEEPPKLELKELPSHFEYAFLEGTDKLSVIISKELKDEEKSALLKDDLKPTVQHQRRVNLKIHEVIKKEVIKLLDARLIYPIYDSPWVSPVHCVPKKGGMTVIENEDNELIPTRCMMAIFHDMIEETMEEKCHFMVKEGIVLGHKISKSMIKVDRAKVDVIAKLPHSTSIEGENHASWSDKLDDALWAFCAAFKTTIGIAPDLEASCARGFFHRPLELQSLANGNPIS